MTGLTAPHMQQCARCSADYQRQHRRSQLVMFVVLFCRSGAAAIKMAGRAAAGRTSGDGRQASTMLLGMLLLSGLAAVSAQGGSMRCCRYSATITGAGVELSCRPSVTDYVIPVRHDTQTKCSSTGQSATRLSTASRAF